MSERGLGMSQREVMSCLRGWLAELSWLHGQPQSCNHRAAIPHDMHTTYQHSVASGCAATVKSRGQILETYHVSNREEHPHSILLRHASTTQSCPPRCATDATRRVHASGHTLSRMHTLRRMLSGGVQARKRAISRAHLGSVRLARESHLAREASRCEVSGRDNGQATQRNTMHKT